MRRKRFEAGLLAQALLIGGPAPRTTAKEPDFWDVLTSAQGVTLVNVEQGHNGNPIG